MGTSLGFFVHPLQGIGNFLLSPEMVDLSFEIGVINLIKCHINDKLFGASSCYVGPFVASHIE